MALFSRCALTIFSRRTGLYGSQGGATDILARSWYSSEGKAAAPEQQQADKADHKEDEVTEEVDEAMALRLKKAEDKIKELEEQLLKSYAERENIRKIGHNDMENAKKYAIRGFAKDVLDVADNLERALSTVKESDLESSPALKALNQGIVVTHNGLHDILKRHQITKIEAAGQKFDPKLHSALFMMQDPAKESNTVGAVIKTGYMLHDRVLRPADVGVIQNP